MIQKQIKKHVRYPEMAQEMGLQGRVNTQFIINKDGSIGTIQKRGPQHVLKQEAEGILKKLPKMTPGQRRTAVKAPFSMLINFKTTINNNPFMESIKGLFKSNKDYI